MIDSASRKPTAVGWPDSKPADDSAVIRLPRRTNSDLGWPELFSDFESDPDATSNDEALRTDVEPLRGQQARHYGAGASRRARRLRGGGEVAAPLRLVRGADSAEPEGEANAEPAEEVRVPRPSPRAVPAPVEELRSSAPDVPTTAHSEVPTPAVAASPVERAGWPRVEGLTVEDGHLEFVSAPSIDDLLGVTPAERRTGELGSEKSATLRDLIHRVVGRAEVDHAGAVPSKSAGATLAEAPPVERGAAMTASADNADPPASTFPESGTEEVQEIDVSDPAQSSPHALTSGADESQRRIRAVLDDATAVPRETVPDPYDVSRETDPLAMDARVLPGDVSRETEDDDLPIAIEARRAVQVLNPGHSTLPRPSARRVLCVANQKGGVGKTTTTVNIAVALALHGNRVMVIDLDPQGNASTGLNVDHRAGVPSTYDVLVDGIPLAEATVAVDGVPNLYCVPATIDLAGAEIELVSVVARENRLRRAIDAFPADIDYIFIDCPPSLGLLTVNALVAAREVLIPIQCEYYALEGLGQLLRNVELVKAHLNNDVQITTILLTMYDGRTKLADQVASEVRGHFGETVLDAVIPRSVRVSEAPGFGQSVITYDPGSRGSTSYLQAAREIAERGARGGHL